MELIVEPCPRPWAGSGVHVKCLMAALPLKVAQAHGVIFLVDATDTVRLEDASDFYSYISSGDSDLHPSSDSPAELQRTDTATLVIANKSDRVDVPVAERVEEIAQAFGRPAHSILSGSLVRRDRDFLDAVTEWIACLDD